MKEISIIIPIYNVEKYVAALYYSKTCVEKDCLYFVSYNKNEGMGR